MEIADSQYSTVNNTKLNLAKYPLAEEDLLLNIANCLIIFNELELSQAYAQYLYNIGCPLANRPYISSTFLGSKQDEINQLTL